MAKIRAGSEKNISPRKFIKLFAAVVDVALYLKSIFYGANENPSQVYVVSGSLQASLLLWHIHDLLLYLNLTRCRHSPVNMQCYLHHMEFRLPVEL